MSLWLEATVELNLDKLDSSRNPIDKLKAIFKKNGKDFDETHAEAEMVKTSQTSIQVSICNRYGYVDCIHNSFKDIVKQCPFVQSIHITSNYYF